MEAIDEAISSIEVILGEREYDLTNVLMDEKHYVMMYSKIHTLREVIEVLKEIKNDYLSE